MISNELRETLHRVWTVLEKHQVDCIIVGGIAVGFHGHTRISTPILERPEIKVDIDLWYNPTTENFIKLIQSLAELGVNKESLNSIVFDPQKTFLKIPHQHFHMDFLPQMKGLASYAAAKNNSVQHLLDGHELFILSYDDLLINKKAVSRTVDSSDVDALEKRKKSNT